MFVFVDGLLVTRTTLAPTTTAVPVPQVIVNGNRHLDYVTSTNVDLVCQSFKNLDKVRSLKKNRHFMKRNIYFYFNKANFKIYFL